MSQMIQDVSESLSDDLYEKTRKQLNTFIDETNALLAAGDALHHDRTRMTLKKLEALLTQAEAPLIPERPMTPPVTHALGKAKAYVSAHPWTAVGAAAGVGLVVSLLLKSR